MDIRFNERSFEETARVLVEINRPTASAMGYEGVIRYMKDETTDVISRNPDSTFWGTMGFYIVMSKTDAEISPDGREYVHAEAVLMPYVVDSYLKQNRLYRDADFYNKD